MTITEEYLRKILPNLALVEGGEVREKPMNGKIAYEFPCPFCAHLQCKDKHRRKRVGILLPHKDSFTYTFYCHRHGAEECQSSRSFPNFLAMYNPTLFRQYQQERYHAGTTGKGHNCSTPKSIKEIKNHETNFHNNNTK